MFIEKVDSCRIINASWSRDWLTLEAQMGGGRCAERSDITVLQRAKRPFYPGRFPVECIVRGVIDSLVNQSFPFL